MAESRSDPRAAILTWLDDPPRSNLHDDLCPTWSANGGTSDEGCDCDHGKMRRALRAALDRHVEVTLVDGQKRCEHEDLTPAPCPEIVAIADALGVAK
ncbi:MAG TPA: hypothetical protein VG497_10305 [Kribbella sp.]|nr:hypothetical protein [Kribbella sp.]